MTEVDQNQYFLKDSLHLNQKGYELWSSIVKPILYDLYKQNEYLKEVFSLKR